MTDEERIRAFEDELRVVAASYGRELDFEQSSTIQEMARTWGVSVAEVIDELRPGMIAQTRKFASGRHDDELVTGTTTPVLGVVK